MPYINITTDFIRRNNKRKRSSKRFLNTCCIEFCRRSLHDFCVDTRGPTISDGAFMSLICSLWFIAGWKKQLPLMFSDNFVRDLSIEMWIGRGLLAPPMVRQSGRCYPGPRPLGQTDHSSQRIPPGRVALIYDIGLFVW